MWRDRALLEVLYGTGCRVSEVVGLNLGDVAEAVEGGDIPLIRVLGKGDKERVVPLGRLALAALQHWLSGEGRPLLEPRRQQRRRGRVFPSQCLGGRPQRAVIASVKRGVMRPHQPIRRIPLVSVGRSRRKGVSPGII